MAKKICSNKVIPEYMPENLPWYERDGLMTYIDQIKYKEYAENKDEYLKNVEVVNFDIIHNHCRGTPLQNSETFYKSVTRKDLKKFPKKEKNDTLAAMAKCPRTDLYVQLDLMIEYFKTLP